MKKLLSIILICISWPMASSAMDRSLIDVCPNEMLEAIVVKLDYQDFIAFAKTCSTGNEICQNVPKKYLESIVQQATYHGNVSIVCKCYNICPDNMVLRSCGQHAYAMFFKGQDRLQLASLIWFQPLSAQDCKSVLLVVVEFASLQYFQQLLTNTDFTNLIDQDAADAVVYKCIELSRKDIVNELLDIKSIYCKASFPALFALSEEYFSIDIDESIDSDESMELVESGDF